MQNKPLILALVSGLVFSGAAQATLTGNGNGLIYDSVLNITWLQNADLAATNNFSVTGINTDGSMTWSTAQTWIAAMNANNYMGHSDWMLPSALNMDGSGPCSGNNCSGSQMGELYYTEGGLTAGDSINASPTLTSTFTNMQGTGQAIYWNTPINVSDVTGWHFSTHSGFQSVNNAVTEGYAWAVLPGNVAAVPEADEWAMLLTGLGLVGVATRRRRG